MADQKSEASQIISETSKQTGGTYKGSPAAQMQSQISKEQNATGTNNTSPGNTTGGTTTGGKSEAGQTISEVSKQTGGTYKGSPAAQMQSQISKEQHATGSNDTSIGKTAGSNTASIPANTGAGKSEAGRAISETSKQTGGTYKGSPAAQMQSQISKEQNATGTNQTSFGSTTGSTKANTPANAGAGLDPTEQSQMTREANYKEAADNVGSKLETDPAIIIKEDGDLLHSRETKAFGTTEKGGLASQVQSTASANAGDKNTF